MLISREYRRKGPKCIVLIHDSFLTQHVLEQTRKYILLDIVLSSQN